jgi:murein DD-endopeptidase MepM/ murein hydrolase activator NlpD
MNIYKKLLISAFSVIIMGCSGGKYHKVKKGDTLYSIAVKNKVSVTDIMSLNNLNTPHINTGTKLLIKGEAENPKVRPSYHVIKPGETLYRLSVWYDVSVEELRTYNNLSDNRIYVGQKIYLNSKYSKEKDHHSNSSTKNLFISPTLKSFKWPIKTKEITSKFGTRIHPITGRKTSHEGVDLKSKMNTPVYAPYSGVVTYSGWMRGYGKIVIISHGNGYESRYAHLNRWLVKKGQKVSKGQIIAKTGNTGLSTGPHLHYEIRKNNKPVDPTITM